MKGVLIYTLLLVANGLQAQPNFPLKISENRRYFVDQDGKPFLYHADRRLPFTHISQLTPVTVDFGYLSDNKFKVRFFDPRFGKYIKETTVENKTVQPVVSPPGEDLVLLIETI